MQHYLIEIISFEGGVDGTSKTVRTFRGAVDRGMAPQPTQKSQLGEPHECWMGYLSFVPGILLDFTICKRGSRLDPVAPSETRDCQSGFNSLNALESGVHRHSGSCDIALKVSEQITRLVPLVDGEFSRGRIPFGIDG
jgi:hypothetical protein